jgi:hypothetical protein
MIVAWQFIAQVRRAMRSVPLGYGVIRYLIYSSWGGASVPSSCSDHHVSKPIIPFPPGRNLCGDVPGNKLPGYDQLVPSGHRSIL